MHAGPAAGVGDGDGETGGSGAMRVRIEHRTHYDYDVPVTSAIQILRLTPRSNANQYVRRWRIDISTDAPLRRYDDPFGNVTHNVAVAGPLTELTITAVGEVDTTDTHGVLAGTVERLPLSLYLRETPLTAPSPAIAAFAREAQAASDGSALDVAHTLSQRVKESIAFDTAGTTVATAAAEVLEKGVGVCQDLSHLYIAAARSIGIPARYVGGYMYQEGAPGPHEAGHAWAEVFLADLGWVAFDPTAGIAPTDAYVRVACGLDYLGASPVRGTRYGGHGEALEVAIMVTDGGGPRVEAGVGSRPGGQVQGDGQAQGGGQPKNGGQSQLQGFQAGERGRSS